MRRSAGQVTPLCLIRHPHGRVEPTAKVSTRPTRTTGSAPATCKEWQSDAKTTGAKRLIGSSASRTKIWRQAGFRLHEVRLGQSLRARQCLSQRATRNNDLSEGARADDMWLGPAPRWRRLGSTCWVAISGHRQSFPVHGVCTTLVCCMHMD